MSFGWWVLVEHTPAAEDRDHAFGPFATRAAATVFMEASPRMRQYHDPNAVASYWNLTVSSHELDHEDIEALGYRVDDHAYIHRWNPDYTGPGEPTEDLVWHDGMQLNPSYWRTGGPVYVPAPGYTCPRCHQTGDHAKGCPGQNETPCTCGLSDCGECGRRPGAVLSYLDAVSRRLPRNQRP